MGPSSAAILTVMLARKPWLDRDMSSDERATMLQPIADAIAEVSRDRLDASLLLALGLHETAFARLVVEGRCDEMPKGQRCDSGHARGVWSLHVEACRDAYQYAAGSVDSVRAEARCALKLLRFHAYRCREHALTPLFGAFAGFGTGSKCHWSGAGARVLTTRRMAAELGKAERH